MILQTLASLPTNKPFLPCIEFPGRYLVIIPEGFSVQWNKFFLVRSAGNRVNDHSFKSFIKAKMCAQDFMNFLGRRGFSFKGSDFKIAWTASDYDPRLGKDWFLSSKTLGTFHCAGNFIRAKE